MAEIHVERKPRGGAGKWIALILFLAVLAVAGWYFLAGPGRAMLEDDEAPAVEVDGLEG